MGLSHKQIALIHIAKQELGLSEEYYRKLLGELGVKSSKELDQAGFQRLMNKFELLGFRRQTTKAKKRGDDVPGMASEGQKAKIWKLWFLWMGGDEDLAEARRQLRNFLFKRFGVSDVRWLTREKAWDVIEALKAMVARRSDEERKKLGG